MNKMSKRFKILNRGAAMATLLVVIALFAVIAFTLASGSTFHLNAASRQNNTVDAKNAAESNMARALEKIIADQTYGDTTKPTISVQRSETGSNASASLTFDPTQATALGIPYSYNNIKGTTGMPGDMNRQVPQNSVHLVSVGNCNGVSQKVEAIIHLPPFPYCIATNGQFTAGKDLLVATVDKTDLSATIDPSKLQPGNLLANSTAVDAVDFQGSGTMKIMGDVQTAGKVKKSDTATIEILGETRIDAAQVTINEINPKLSSYDPSARPDVKDPGTLQNNPTFQGYYKAAGNLDITGNLKMDGALLFVQNNLTISGGITGKGAIIVMGNMQLGKGADFASDNLVAVLTQGNVSLGLLGSKSSSYFQGIVYCEGDFSAQNISICGAFINKGGTGSKVALSDVNAYRVPEYNMLAPAGGGNDFCEFKYGSNCSVDQNAQNNIDANIPLKTAMDDFTSKYSGFSPTWSCRKNNGKIELKMDGKPLPAGLPTHPADDAFATFADMRDYVESFYTNTTYWSAYIIANYQTVDPVHAPSYPTGAAYFSGYFIKIDPVTHKSPRQLIQADLNTWRDQFFKDATFQTAIEAGLIKAEQIDFSLDISQFLNSADRMKVRLWQQI
jgi:hypothetical protein